MINIRHISESDYESWSALYSSYAEFYNVTQTKEMRDRVWAWLHDLNHEVNGFIAVSDDEVAMGFIHYRSFSRPLSATTGGFIDDLFVQPSARGMGIAKLLINSVTNVGKHHGWSVIRWITAEDNLTARQTYDKVAKQTSWLTYDIKL